MLSSFSEERFRCETLNSTLTSPLIRTRGSTGVSSGVARGGEQRQEVHQKEDGLEEDRGKHYHGQ